MNPFVGVFFHWLGGLASGSFYVPYRSVKKWSWEVYWLAGGVFSWIFAPWIAAFFLTENLFPVLLKACSQHPGAVGMAFLFGMMWGLGGLTFGLTMRYLGMSLGMAIALGYCTAFGFLMPPLFKFDRAKFLEGDWSVFLQGEFVTKMLGTTSGNIILFGVAVCMLGIVIAALAGTSKEREMSEEAKKAAIKEFSFVKGLMVATFSGIMSAGMSYGMAAAGPIADLTQEAGTLKMWSELPRLCVILAGGFLSNFLWCAFLFMKNGTGYQFFASHIPDEPGVKVTEEMKKSAPNVPMITNYIFCAVAGVTWYLQFFFYSMGETQMGAYQFSSWPLHMASIMIFSSIWGLALHEWKGSSGYTKTVLFVTLFTLILSTMIIGYGTQVGKVDKEGEFLNLAAKVDLQNKLIAFVDSPEELASIKESVLENIKPIAKFAPLKEGEKEPEDITKRKIEGLLADCGLSGYEKPFPKEGEAEQGPKKMTLSEQLQMAFVKTDAQKLGQENSIRLIQSANALAETDDAEAIRKHCGEINAALQNLVEFLNEQKGK